MRRRTLLALSIAMLVSVSVLASAAQAAPGSLRVLLVQTQGTETFSSFIGALKAKPGVAAVDSFEGSVGTPTASTLAGYDLIVSTGDADYQDATLYGNRLADYIDAGGAVIEFAYDNWEEDGAHPTGRFAAGGYPPFVPGPNDNADTTLGTLVVPNSPLLAAVPSFSTGLNTTDALAPGATLIAKYADGRNAIATKGRVASVTATPGYEGDPGQINPISAAAQLALNAGNVLGRHTLTVKKKGGSGTVTSVPTGIKCGKTCTATFVSGTALTLTAKKKSSFRGWKGVDGCGKGSKCTFTPTSNVTIKARFGCKTKKKGKSSAESAKKKCKQKKKKG
jgi:Divergent InlB B-repeat domain